MITERIARLAAQLVARATSRGFSIATAESLTGGLVASALVDSPGASVTFRGGVVSYHTGIKHAVLGVDASLLADVGAVDPLVAQMMAERVRELCSLDGGAATLGLATTGVAGPATQDGHPVGEVFVAVATAYSTRVERAMFSGSRSEIREQSVAAVLQLAVDVVAEMSDGVE